MSKSANPWRRFLDRPKDDLLKTFGVAMIVAFFSALVVSTASIMLKPLQQANFAAERQARMERMLDTLPGLRDLMLEAGVDTLETRMVDLSDGTFAEGLDPASFDLADATNDPETSIALPQEVDVAGLKRRSNFAPVYLLEREGELQLIVLPVFGAGYQSTIRAMLAIKDDLKTIAALAIVEQGETPGLGARIEDPGWQALWPGKLIFGPDGEVVIEVVRGEATGPYSVDGVSGATRTGNGVTNMLRFWLGDWGYGPLLDRLATEGV